MFPYTSVDVLVSIIPPSALTNNIICSSIKQKTTLSSGFLYELYSNYFTASSVGVFDQHFSDADQGLVPNLS